MWLQKVNLHHIRNISTAQFAFEPHFNVIYGKNGSGKTSVLEAIHILSTGRSFRTPYSREVLQLGAPSFVVSGVVGSHTQSCNTIRLGIEKTRGLETKIRRNEGDCHSIAQIARDLPLQVINSDSFTLLEAGPSYRRQYLDWGMFHVEHSFYGVWQRFKKGLAQRNALLKQTKVDAGVTLESWDHELGNLGCQLDAYRKAYLVDIVPLIQAKVYELLGYSAIEIRYDRGWREPLSYAQALLDNLSYDKMSGTTHKGPHRANLEILMHGIPIKSLLSRGQLKLFVYAMLLARAQLLQDKLGLKAVFLIDDLAAELDVDASQLLLSSLAEFGGQVILTTVDAANVPVGPHQAPAFHLLAGALVNESMFHVEHEA